MPRGKLGVSTQVLWIAWKIEDKIIRERLLYLKDFKFNSKKKTIGKLKDLKYVYE